MGKSRTDVSAGESSWETSGCIYRPRDGRAKIQELFCRGISKLLEHIFQNRKKNSSYENSDACEKRTARCCKIKS